MYVIYFAGLLVMFFGIISLFSVYRADEDELPAPKEQLYISGFLVIMVGLLFFESAKIGDRLVDDYKKRQQNMIKFIK
jgi:uncharacterized membrane protein HdeD (DUF308 family)